MAASAGCRPSGSLDRTNQAADGQSPLGHTCGAAMGAALVAAARREAAREPRTGTLVAASASLAAPTS
ncbi:MAG: hypothetical protein HOV96_32990 [Nonomuraea sp.]|nr:hypothetical protein [Nonomuraea sp.]NUP82369.1 hypothetical protein [Nonomuraea sp.]